MSKESYSIIALPGDGIGPEVLEGALHRLGTIGQLFGVRFDVERLPCGGQYYLEHEKEWPDGSFEKCQATERAVRFAFHLARRRNKQKKVTCVDKSNIVGAHRYFRDIFQEIGQSEFPDIELDYAYVDAFCQWQIRNPEWYDVVVCPNLVGDIVSDNGATTQGGLRIAAGGNIGDAHAMFEPIHGSAPKHAGQDKANPIAMMLALHMMLDWLGNRYADERLKRAAVTVEAAVAAVLEEGKTLTYDLVGPERAARCSEVGMAIDEKLHLMHTKM